jgi:Mn-dependent DtxR family transcriptional regulator
MEVEGMVTKAERAGIVTTHKGSRKMIELMQDRYRLESAAVLGTAILDELGKITA